MTPEPTGGDYTLLGPAGFVRKYGYADKMGRIDRLNFGGIHRANSLQANTGLTLAVRGFDVASGKITDAEAGIALVTTENHLAALWPYTTLLKHWSRKHAHAAYVPSMNRELDGRQYCYGHLVRLGYNTNPVMLIQAFAAGRVYYDPGIKLECASSSPRLKRRSQFRVHSRDLPMLYESMATVDVLTG